MAAAVTGRIPSAPFDMRCERFHPVHCPDSLRADSSSAMVAVAMDHGAWVHGFTPAFYSEAKRRAMAAEVTRFLDSRAQEWPVPRPTSGAYRAA